MAGVTFHVDGLKEREVEFVKYELMQGTDVQGQPTGRTRGGKIHLRIKDRDDGNTEIPEWMMDSYGIKSGWISYPKANGSEKKRLTFTDSYVVEYSDTYDVSDPEHVIHYEDFTISARLINVGSATHNNDWAGYNS